MAKHNHKGRSKEGERHVRLTNFMTDTQAWLSLTPAQRAVYLEVARVFNGANNGYLGVSVRSLAARCRINKDTASAALKVLEDRGFIVCMTPGGFSRKSPHAAEWRLTDWPCHKTHEPATKAFQKWRPSVNPPPAPIQKSRTRSGLKGQSVRKEGTVRKKLSPLFGQSRLNGAQNAVSPVP